MTLREWEQLTGISRDFDVEGNIHVIVDKGVDKIIFRALFTLDDYYVVGRLDDFDNLEDDIETFLVGLRPRNLFDDDEEEASINVEHFVDCTFLAKCTPHEVAEHVVLISKLIKLEAYAQNNDNRYVSFKVDSYSKAHSIGMVIRRCVDSLRITYCRHEDDEPVFSEKIFDRETHDVRFW
jgi:hypothetical protein